MAVRPLRWLLSHVEQDGVISTRQAEGTGRKEWRVPDPRNREQWIWIDGSENVDEASMNTYLLIIVDRCYKDRSGARERLLQDVSQLYMDLD